MFDKLLGSIFVVFIAGIIGLIGWGIYEAVTAPDAGYVIGHEYHPAWTSVSCHGTKPVICIPTYYPPRYCLVLRADDGNEGEHCVDEKTYNDFKVGSHYPDPR